jgi:hypothetical protein
VANTASICERPAITLPECLHLGQDARAGSRPASEAAGPVKSSFSARPRVMGDHLARWLPMPAQDLAGVPAPPAGAEAAGRVRRAREGSHGLIYRSVRAGKVPDTFGSPSR